MYKEDTLLPYSVLRPILKELKVGIKEEMTFADFNFFLNHGPYKVIILIAHWFENKVEFFDSFYNTQQILDVFPLEKPLAIDLNICTCKTLAENLGINRIFCLVKHNKLEMPSYAGAWFLFYKYFFKLIAEQDLNYLEALQKTSALYQNIFK